MNQNVLVFGSAGFDLFAISKHFRSSGDGPTPTIEFEHPSQIWLDNSIIEPGGNGLLAAITCARQGIETELCSTIGADSLGKSLQTIIAEEEIIDTAIKPTAAHSTDIHIHLTSSGPDQTTLHYTGAFLSNHKKDLNSSLLPFRWLHIADIPAEKKVLQALLDLAAKADARVSINPRYVHTYHTGWLIKILRQCTLVFLNRDEASLLLGGYFSIREAAEKLRDIGIAAGAVYDNVDGCCVFYGNSFYQAGQYGKTKTLDPSGAEAVFAAAFVASTLAEAPIEERITHASAQAASVQSIVGARSAILQKPALRKLDIIQQRGEHYEA